MQPGHMLTVGSAGTVAFSGTLPGPFRPPALGVCLALDKFWARPLVPLVFGPLRVTGFLGGISKNRCVLIKRSLGCKTSVSRTFVSSTSS